MTLMGVSGGQVMLVAEPIDPHTLLTQMPVRVSCDSVTLCLTTLLHPHTACIGRVELDAAKALDP